MSYLRGGRSEADGGGESPSVAGNAGKRTRTTDLASAASTREDASDDAAGKGAKPLEPAPGTQDGAKPAPAGAAAAGTASAAPAAGPVSGGRAPSLSASLVQMRTLDIPKTPQGGMSYTTVSGPTANDPGGFSWVVQWKLDAPSPAGGWIVQGVTVTADVTDKAGKVIEAGADARFGYWEAWQVNKGKSVTTYAETGDTADDTYARPKSANDTKGTIKVFGSAEFYEGLTLPSAFAPDTSSPAGILPIVRAKPTLAGGTGAISHNLTATWDATAGNTKTTITT